jgi:hypothetical protein
VLEINFFLIFLIFFDFFFVHLPRYAFAVLWHKQVLRQRQRVGNAQSCDPFKFTFNQQHPISSISISNAPVMWPFACSGSRHGASFSFFAALVIVRLMLS